LSVTPLALLARSKTCGEWREAFLKIGGTLFGSGYVLLSYLQSSFVDTAWLAHAASRCSTR